MILVGDVGGTNTRLALAVRRSDRWQLNDLRVQPTVADPGSQISDFLRSAGNPALTAFACAAAGPLADDGSIRLTNHSGHLRPAALAAAAGLSQATLINDFAAIAHALPVLSATDLHKLGSGSPVADAARLVLGPGTGLGVATALPQGKAWTVLAGEGGHAELAPSDDEQLKVWTTLRGTHGRVAAETVLSGPGIERLYATLAPGHSRTAAQITAAAWRGATTERRTIEIFTRWLGSFAGDLALILGARGGVYLGGGILPAWQEHFDGDLFRAGFENKPPYTAWLRAIPGYLITHPQPALIGLAELASEVDLGVEADTP